MVFLSLNGSMLKRFWRGSIWISGNSVHNPVVPGFKLTKDEEGVEVDSTLYKQMVGSLMYLTATRPDLMFVYCQLTQ